MGDTPERSSWGLANKEADMPSDDTTISPQLTVEVWADPVVDALGFPAHHPYAKLWSSQSPRSLSASTVDLNRLASVLRLNVLERCLPTGSRYETWNVPSCVVRMLATASRS